MHFLTEFFKEPANVDAGQVAHCVKAKGSVFYEDGSIDDGCGQLALFFGNVDGIALDFKKVQVHVDQFHGITQNRLNFFEFLLVSGDERNCGHICFFQNKREEKK